MNEQVEEMDGAAPDEADNVIEEIAFHVLSNALRGFAPMHPHSALRVCARLTGELKALQCECHNTEESLTKIIEDAMASQHQITKLAMMPVPTASAN